MKSRGALVMQWLTAAAIIMALSPMAVLAQEGGLFLPDNVVAGVSLDLGEIDAAEPEKLLKVFVGPSSACCSGRSAVAGRYSLSGDMLTFEPAFKFIEGQVYTALRYDGGKVEFAIPSDAVSKAPEVVAIYPSGPSIPENTLRFYIEFSRPMQPHRAGEFITLRGEDGTPDRSAFMNFKQELWSSDRTRLTLLMDPGRIKRGVAMNLELGSALIEGQAYSIVIEEGWPTAFDGQEVPRFEKRYTITSPLRTLPDPASWSISHPRAKSRDTLEIVFDRPFDQQSVARLISVADETGETIDGQFTVADDQRSLRFEPRHKWDGEHIEIVIDPSLEDVAGNNFHELLDHELGTEAVKRSRVLRRLMLKQ